MGRGLSLAYHAAAYRRAHELSQAGKQNADHDRRRFPAQHRLQRLHQAHAGAEHPARKRARPRAVRLRLQAIRPPLGLQAADAGGFLPHHGRRQRTGSRLVLARLVLHHRPHGHFHRDHPSLCRRHARSLQGKDRPQKQTRRGTRTAVSKTQQASPQARGCVSGAEGFLQRIR